MAEENLSSQSKKETAPATPVPATPAPATAAPAPTAPKKEAAPAKKSRFSKIPKEVLFSPGGMVLIFFALFIELLDLIPIPFLDQLWEIPLELLFIFLLITIAKVPIKSCLIPFIIERIPIINDILPTWLLRLFV